MTIYSKFRFDYHKAKQPGMVNVHIPPKNVPILKSIMVFSKRLDMLSVSVILLQY